MIEFLNQYGDLWAEYFGLAVVQNTIFLGLVFFALFLLRNASARIKHTIALIGLFKLLLPPMLPAPFLQKSVSIPTVPLDTAMVQPIVAIQTITPSVHFDLIGSILIGWIIGTVTLLLFSIISNVRLMGKLRNSEPIQLENMDINLGRRVVKLYKTDSISMPLSIGLFSNKILVPKIWEQWSDDCRKMILQHELAHIKHRDGLVQICQIIVQAIYFFHPLVWLLGRRINEYREMACDDSSIACKKGSSIEYSKYLIEIAENLIQNQLGCAAASTLIKQKNELLHRVQYQIMEDTMRKNSKIKIGLVLAALFLMIAPLSWTISKEIPQEKPKTNASEKLSLDSVGKFLTGLAPQPEGGIEAIQKNLVYPEAAKKAGLEGQVVVNVVLDEKCSIKETSIKETSFESDLGCHQAAIDAVKSVKWKPGTLRKEYSDGSVLTGGGTFSQDIPISFKLAGSSSTATSVIEASVETGKITGTVTAKDTGEPIPAVNIVVNGTTMGAASDKSGQFFIINVPPGKYTLKASMIGYKTMVVSSVNVETAKSNTVNMELEQAIISGPEVKVEADYPESSPSFDIQLLKTGKDETIFVPYEKPPSPIGGMAAIQQHLIIPESVKKAGKIGHVEVGALINVKGDVEKTKILKSLGKDCDEAAIKAVKAVKWEPAMQRDKPVKVWLSVKIDFNLDKSNSKSSSSALPYKHTEVVDANPKTHSNSNQSLTNDTHTTTFVHIEKMPSPIGGYKAIQQKLKYPEIARKVGIEGTVKVLAKINEKGEIIETQIGKSLGNNGCNEAAMNAIKSVKWEPAMQRDKPITVWLSVPVRFQLRG